MNEEKALELIGIEKSFGANQVLRGVNVQVEEGQVLCVLGPSGSGKSTLLRCATFLEQMDSGLIRYGGQTALEMKDGVKTSAGDEKRFRKDFGLVFSKLQPVPALDGDAQPV